MNQRSNEETGSRSDSEAELPGWSAGEGGVADSAALEAELVRVRAQSDEYLRSWQRAQADYQNLRRRVASDIESETQRAKKGLVTELLLVLDYLEMALAAECTSKEAQSLRAGVEMTRTALLSALEREGVRPIPEGGRFDAAIHQAVERVETEDVPAGNVIATLRKGYMHNDLVLRPAQVKVAVEPQKLARDAEDRG